MASLRTTSPRGAAVQYGHQISGVADFGFFHQTGKGLLARTQTQGRPSLRQDGCRDFLSWMGASGHGAALCWSYDDAVTTLIDWQILRSLEEFNKWNTLETTPGQNGHCPKGHVQNGHLAVGGFHFAGGGVDRCNHVLGNSRLAGGCM